MPDSAIGSRSGAIDSDLTYRQTATLPARASPSAKPSAAHLSLPRPLEGWRGPADGPVPLGLRELRTARQETDAALLPIDLKELTVLLDQTLALFEDRRPANWGHIAEFYLEALEDVPADLAREALRHVRRNVRFFPKPADLRAPIVEELARRQHIRLRLRLAQMMANHEQMEEA